MFGARKVLFPVSVVASLMILFASCGKPVQRQRVGNFTYLPPAGENWKQASSDALALVPNSSVPGVDVENCTLFQNDANGAMVVVQNYLFNGTEEDEVTLDSYFEGYKEKASALGEVILNEFKPEGNVRIMQALITFPDADYCSMKTLYYDAISMQALAFDVIISLSARDALQQDLTKLLDSVEYFDK